MFGIGSNGFALTGAYRVQKTNDGKWETLRETVKYNSCWERVPYIGQKTTAREQMALTRNSVNRLTSFTRSHGRGNAVYNATQQVSDD